MATFVKVESNLCRCCHEEGLFVNLELPSKCTGEEKTYGELLKFCFDIQIKPIDKSESDVTYTICSSCIENLSSAVQFKKQVISCEERFQLMLSQKEHLPVCDVQIPVKKEKSEDELSKRSHSPCETDEDNEFLAFFANPSKRKRSKSDSSDDTKQGNILLDLLSTQQNGGTLRGSRKTVKTRKKVKKSKLTVAKKSGEKKIEVVSDGDEKKANGKDQKSKCVTLAPFEGQYSIVEEENKNKYLCRCGSLLSSAYSLKYHMIRTHLRTAIMCPCCCQEFKTLAKRRLHLAQVHSLEERGVNKTLMPVSKSSCGHCSMEFPSESLLKEHDRFAHVLQKCSQCSAMFSKKDMVKHKMQNHAATLPTCGVCGFQSATEYYVRMHQRVVHLKEKHIKCELCDLRFYNRNKLTKHMIVHNPVRKYECSYCHKRFPRKTTLQIHERIHTGDKKKVCRICGDKFVQKSSLNYHMSKHHPEERF